MRMYYKDKLLYDTAFTYNDLEDKPSINDFVLEGNPSSRELNMYDIPTFDRLLRNSHPIKVVDRIPSITQPVTTYYVGPTKENFYDIWMYDIDNKPIYLGNTLYPTLSPGEGMKIEEIESLIERVTIARDNITIQVDSEGRLVCEAVEAGEGINILESNKQYFADVFRDVDSLMLNSEGELIADAYPKPFELLKWLGIDSEGKPIWKRRSLNGVDLLGDHNTEQTRVIWFGSQYEYDHIVHNPYTLYIINAPGNSEGDAITAEVSYNNLGLRPVIEDQVITGDKSSSSLNMYLSEEVDELLASIRNVKVVVELPTVPDAYTLYYQGTAVPYDLYMVDDDLNYIYLGTSKEPEIYTGIGASVDQDSREVSLKTLSDPVEDAFIKGTQLSVRVFDGSDESVDGTTGIVPVPNNKNNYLINSSTWGTKQLKYMTGEIKMYAGKAVPSGWLICDGTEVKRDDFPDLFAAIGTTFGPGDGLNTFNLPNFTRRFVEGAGLTNLGASHEDGLPNITGRYMYGYADQSSITFLSGGQYAGAFRQDYFATIAFTYGSSFHRDNQPRGFSFDASRATDSGANEIYGKNYSWVQPEAVCINYIIKY